MARNHRVHVAALATLFTLPALADVWDFQLHNDDSAVGSRNELLHGTIQTHDLGARPGPAEDQDWYRIPQKPQTSYEVIIDGASGDINFQSALAQRMAEDGMTVLQTDIAAVAFSNGFSRALRWVNPSVGVIQFIRVSRAFCSTGCGPDDLYTIRMRETTVNVPRFNTSGGQATVLLTQNASDRPVNLTYFFWSATGTLLSTRALGGHPSKGLDAFNLATDAALVGQSGSITVAHDGGYGALVIKAVALEPSTGFSFDTPGVYVPD